MNRLTRKTNEKDFGNKDRVYYMYDDENTLEKFIEKYPYHLINYVRFTDCNEIINKLGRFEDLEEKLGYSLEDAVEILEIITKCIIISHISYDENDVSKTAYDYVLEFDDLSKEEYDSLDKHFQEALKEEE